MYFRTQEGQQRFFQNWALPCLLTPQEARKQAIRILQGVALGKDPSAERQALRSAPTVSELCDDYAKDMQSGKVNGKKQSTIKSDLIRINTHIRPKLGKLKVISVTKEQVEEFMHGLSPGSAKRIVGLLSAIFTFAGKKKLRTDNPCHGIEKPKDVVKLRRLSSVEYEKLGAALNGDNAAADVFLFLAISGWRSSEANNLRFSEVDLERRVATLGDTKSGMSVRPLSSASIEIIKRQPVRNGQFVFEYKNWKPISNLTSWWKKLKMPNDITPHSLRHSFASLAADIGLSDHLIAGMLGHARRSITSRYMHLSDVALIETADKVADVTLKLMKA